MTSGKLTMQDLTLERAKRIYRAAVDSQASDAEGAAWWSDVHAELGQVLAARSAGEAAKVIDWWHHDWSMVGDTAKGRSKTNPRSSVNCCALTRKPWVLRRTEEC